jgi:hypothetical protein
MVENRPDEILEITFMLAWTTSASSRVPLTLMSGCDLQ